jgi:hypothetical protein
MIRAIRLLVYDTDIHRTSPPLTKAAKAGALCMVVRKEDILKAMVERDAEDGFSLIADPVYVPLSR